MILYFALKNKKANFYYYLNTIKTNCYSIKSFKNHSKMEKCKIGMKIDTSNEAGHY